MAEDELSRCKQKLHHTLRLPDLLTRSPPHTAISSLVIYWLSLLDCSLLSPLLVPAFMLRFCGCVDETPLSCCPLYMISVPVAYFLMLPSLSCTLFTLPCM